MGFWPIDIRKFIHFEPTQNLWLRKSVSSPCRTRGKQMIPGRTCRCLPLWCLASWLFHSVELWDQNSCDDRNSWQRAEKIPRVKCQHLGWCRTNNWISFKATLTDWAATIFNGNSEFDLDVDQIWTKNAFGRRQVYFSMVTALRKGHFRREWLQDCWTCSTSCTNLKGQTQQIVEFLETFFPRKSGAFCEVAQCVGREDSKTFKRPLLLPLDLDSARTDVDAAWYMALVGVPRGQKS